jgi:hypothetical protein
LGPKAWVVLFGGNIGVIHRDIYTENVNPVQKRHVAIHSLGAIQRCTVYLSWTTFQESLSPAERRQITEELGRDSLPDICHSIDNLNTALSFLKALGGSMLATLHDFMAGPLKMKRTIHSQKVSGQYKPFIKSSRLLEPSRLQESILFSWVRILICYLFPLKRVQSKSAIPLTGMHHVRSCI